ncbi:KinB-signaling pathway activation protein [Piscibacillus salipiscarius]|uniref:KinB-signaling pathway activation protein n=1 Tax=Piscibacillus salipiscarius TaxID=299480 RepID=UPI0024365CB8|nr:KinB-signaling pathway activation protein [Piscibacillus salipiscarius]
MVKILFSITCYRGCHNSYNKFFVQTHAYTPYLEQIDLWNLLGAILWFIGWGLVYSVISQMGFFAYLTVHQFGRGFLVTFGIMYR